MNTIRELMELGKKVAFCDMAKALKSFGITSREMALPDPGTSFAYNAALRRLFLKAARSQQCLDSYCKYGNSSSWVRIGSIEAKDSKPEDLKEHKNLFPTLLIEFSFHGTPRELSSKQALRKYCVRVIHDQSLKRRLIDAMGVDLSSKTLGALHESYELVQLSGYDLSRGMQNFIKMLNCMRSDFGKEYYGPRHSSHDSVISLRSLSCNGSLRVELDNTFAFSWRSSLSAEPFSQDDPSSSSLVYQDLEECIEAKDILFLEDGIKNLVDQKANIRLAFRSSRTQDTLRKYFLMYKEDGQVQPFRTYGSGVIEFTPPSDMYRNPERILHSLHELRARMSSHVCGGFMPPVI